MKTFYSILLKSIIAALFFAGVTSCLKEDRGDCVDPRGNVRLLVKFDPEMYELPEDEHRIDSVNVYVFGADGKFVTSWAGGAYDYAYESDYEVPFDLEPGEYQFVVWSNLCETFLVTPDDTTCEPQITSMEEMQLYLACGEERCFRSDIPDLHYGVFRQALIENTRQSHVYTAHLLPNTYRINMAVKGLPATTDEYEFAVRASNSHFTFDNSIVSDKDDFQHIRAARFDGGDQLAATMRLLPLTDGHCLPATRAEGDRSPQFSFSNTTAGVTYYSDDLVAMIRTAYQSAGLTVDFDRTYTFDVELLFDDRMNVSVSVNGWTYLYNPNEL